jgi:hypothetical protein
MFEYVASGCSSIKLFYKESGSPENVEFFGKTFGTLNGPSNHKFSLLYNAFTEKMAGPIFKEKFRQHIYGVHADSGGLQMITLGKTITEQLKRDVYTSQSNYSDVAMCFDVIPVRIAGTKSDRLDLSGRTFDKTQLESTARATGKNIREQIELFLKEKTVARPYIIAQGNCYDSYMKWIEYIVDELPTEYIKYVGGIAMGAAALGTGTLEDIKRAFYFTQLPIDLESKHMHLLGVGSIARLLPNLVFVQNGLYADTEISYDSTTHTIGTIMGRYYSPKGNIDISRHFDNKYQIVLDDINRNFPGVMQMTVEQFHESMNTPTRVYDTKHGSPNNPIQAHMAYSASGIKNFIEQLNGIYLDKKVLLKTAKGDSKNYLSSLYNVKTKEDFDKWLRYVGPSVDSSPVEIYTERNSLEEFFA